MRADIRWLDQPEVFRINQQEAHSDHTYYRDYEELESGKTSMVQSLNGSWKFCFSENAKSRPKFFYEPGYDVSGFDEIQVPGHIELAGYDQIRYINQMYPWEGHSYRRGAYTMEAVKDGAGMFSEADYNPVGSYVKKFDLEEGLRGKRITLCFEGVEQAMFVWLNGEFIGYAEDSFTPSEFDLTPYIRNQGNILAVEVYKHSTAAFLEGQDFFRFFGIFRNVTLKAKPDAHVEDLWINPVLKQDGEGGSLLVQCKISSVAETHLKAGIRLEDPEGQIQWISEISLEEQCENYVGTLEQEFAKVVPWSYQNPYLYRIWIELKNEKEEFIEVVPYAVGFRRLEIKDQVLYLNGNRLILTGVNRHEWSARTGRCIGGEEMKSDMECIKRNHINAVRTCHYPNQFAWYEMCDREGIYVMSETNLESHGSFQKLGAVEPSVNVPGSLPQWKEVVVDRARTHYETLKNHTSILFWSLGNESYAGDNIQTMQEYLKEKKDGRVIHYEGVFHNRSYEDRISDVESRMYATPQEAEEYVKHHPKKPFLLCEFMHNMGNSMGGLDSYMKLIDQYPSFQGGFIWDLIDQALWVKDEVTGREVLRYGGDFDDRPSDYEFSGNGLLFADRTEKPAMQEVRYFYGLYN